MTTLFISHTSFLEHDTGYGHPERADRLRAIERALADKKFDCLVRMEAPLVDIEDIVRAHPKSYVNILKQAVPQDEARYLDADTVMSPESWEAINRAAGAGVEAVDQVMAGNVRNAFCAVRPPGHHAEQDRAMGFCFFNNIAVAAHYAKAKYGLEKVAIIDFDVHHGNGTQDIFWKEKDVFYGSSHEMPLFPGTGSRLEKGAGNIHNVPLEPESSGHIFRQEMERHLLGPLDDFSPDFVFISAGFDGHRDDPLATLMLTEDDFGWVTQQLVDIAENKASGRLVSMLEGGYNLESLAQSVAMHVSCLME